MQHVCFVFAQWLMLVANLFFWDLSQLGVSGFETRVMTRSEGVILKKDSFKMTPLNTYGFQLAWGGVLCLQIVKNDE